MDQNGQGKGWDADPSENVKIWGVSEFRVPLGISKEVELCHKSLEPDLHSVEILQAYLKGMLIRRASAAQSVTKKPLLFYRKFMVIMSPLITTPRSWAWITLNLKSRTCGLNFLSPLCFLARMLCRTEQERKTNPEAQRNLISLSHERWLLCTVTESPTLCRSGLRVQTAPGTGTDSST